jgi:hypothetical protein
LVIPAFETNDFALAEPTPVAAERARTPTIAAPPIIRNFFVFINVPFALTLGGFLAWSYLATAW